MKNPTRRDAVLVGLTGFASICFAPQASAMQNVGSVTGRALDHNGAPAKKLKCYVSGADKLQSRGKYNELDGSFSFPDIPEGTVIDIELFYNGQPFNYLSINPLAMSRLEVRFPLSASSWTPPNQLPPVSAVVSALGSIASFALKLRRSEQEIRTDFLGENGWIATDTTLQAIAKVLDDLDLFDAERQLITNLHRDTRSLWSTLG